MLRSSNPEPQSVLLKQRLPTRKDHLDRRPHRHCLEPRYKHHKFQAVPGTRDQI